MTVARQALGSAPPMVRCRRTCVVALALVTACGSDPAPIPEPGTGGFRTVSFRDGTFVAVGADDDGQAAIAWSSDGLSFTPAVVPLVPRLLDVAAGATGWVAIGHADEDAAATAVVLLSEDGASWRRVSGPSVRSLLAIGHGNGTFVSIAAPEAGETTKAYVSTDGESWDAVAADTGGSWSLEAGLAFDGGQFQAYGASSQLATSVDGRSWSVMESGLTWIHSLQPRRTGGLVGTATYDCCFGESPEAITRHLLSYDVTTGWQDVETDRSLEAVRVEGTTVIAAGDDIVRAEGPLGTGSWTVVDDHPGRSIASDGAGTWVVVGMTGGILVSEDDGVHWSLDTPSGAMRGR